jgi:hypothetical protein
LLKKDAQGRQIYIDSSLLQKLFNLSLMKKEVVSYQVVLF